MFYKGKQRNRCQKQQESEERNASFLTASERDGVPKLRLPTLKGHACKMRYRDQPSESCGGQDEARQTEPI